MHVVIFNQQYFHSQLLLLVWLLDATGLLLVCLWRLKGHISHDQARTAFSYVQATGWFPWMRLEVSIIRNLDGQAVIRTLGN